jgi:hypothetical protein
MPETPSPPLVQECQAQQSEQALRHSRVILDLTAGDDATTDSSFTDRKKKEGVTGEVLRPGAFRMPGTIDTSSEFVPDDTAATTEPTVTATAVEPGALEAEIRRQILKEMVTASSVEPETNPPAPNPPFWKRNGLLIAIAVVFLAVTVVVVGAVLAVVLTQQGDNSEPLDDLLGYLKSIAPDEGTSLEDVNSPQYRSYEWLSAQTNVNGRLEQRNLYTMAVLYYSLGGENWTHRDGWLENSDVCSWYLGSETPCQAKPKTGKSNGGIERLLLNNNSLQGSIPAELYHLRNTLLRLDLSDNALTGSMPAQLFAMGLNTVVLDRNRLSGSIPGSTLRSVFQEDNDPSSEVPAPLRVLSLRFV